VMDGPINLSSRDIFSASPTMPGTSTATIGAA